LISLKQILCAGTIILHIFKFVDFTNLCVDFTYSMLCAESMILHLFKLVAFTNLWVDFT